MVFGFLMSFRDKFKKMPVTQSSTPGMRIGRKYRLERRLAAGGMGEIWVARNEATGADVAVKLCRDGAAGEDARLRFRHEARLAAMLSHRHIVRIFDLVEDADGALLLVMELLRGQALDRYLESHGPLPANQAIAIILPVLSALAHAHDLGIVHRDVSPANVFLTVDPDGHCIPKLVDFGIAKLPGSGVETVEGRVLGTPRYMAPERIRGLSDVDGKSDLFSIAVILYEMITGTSPFEATSPSASLAAVLERVVDPDPRIDPRLWIEVQRGLAKRAYERHSGAREMADRLRPACGETGASLAHWLQRSPQPREKTPDASRLGATMPGGGATGLGPRFLAHRRALAICVMLGTASGSLALVFGAVHHRRTAAPPVDTVAPEPRPSAMNPVPSAPEPGVSAPPASSDALAAPVMQSTPVQSRAIRTRRAKPVATTPGF
jgi:serine/threonine protein kinase